MTVEHGHLDLLGELRFGGDAGTAGLVALSGGTGATPSYGKVGTGGIADDAVTFQKLGHIAEARLVGRQAESGTGPMEALTAAQLKTILDYAAADVSYSGVGSGLAANNVQAALDEIDAAVDALAAGAPRVLTVDASGGATASFPSSANEGDKFIVLNAAAGGTTFGSTNTIVANSDDILLAKQDGASTTDGSDWHLIDSTDRVASVAGKTGAVTLEAADIVSGTFPTARLGVDSVTAAQILAGAIGTSELAASAVTGAKVANGTLDLGKLAGQNPWTVVANATGVFGSPTAITATQLVTLLNQGTGSIDADLIPEAAVTQHEAALTVLTSQLSGTISSGQIADGAITAAKINTATSPVWTATHEWDFGSTGLAITGNGLRALPDAGNFLGSWDLWPGDGHVINRNPEFAHGLTGWGTYDNGGSGNVTRAVVADADAPNSTGQVLEISYNGGGGTSPGFGGFHAALDTNDYSKGDVLVWRVIAKVPVGRTLNMLASNSTGTESVNVQLTDGSGTGEWKTYHAVRKVGQTGSFSSTGFFYVHIGADAAFDWQVARAECFVANRGSGIINWRGELYLGSTNDKLWHESNIGDLTTALAGESAWLPTNLLTGTISSGQIASNAVGASAVDLTASYPWTGTHSYTSDIGLGATINYTSDSGTILALDGKAALVRHTANGALSFGADDTLILGCGESRSTVAANVTLANEVTFVASDNEVQILSNLQLGWGNRKAWKFNGSGTAEFPGALLSSTTHLEVDDTLNVRDGYYIDGTQVMQSSRMQLNTLRDLRYTPGTISFRDYQPNLWYGADREGWTGTWDDATGISGGDLFIPDTKDRFTTFDMTSVAASVTYEVTGSTIPTTTNVSSIRAFLVWHGGSAYDTVSFEVQRNDDVWVAVPLDTTWSTSGILFSEPFHSHAPYPTYTQWKGVRFKFTDKSTTTGNRYLYGIGLYAARSFAYPYVVSKSGDKMYGTLSTELVQPRTGSTYDIGTTANRYRDAYLSGGLDVGQEIIAGTDITASGTIAGASVTSGGNAVLTTASTIDASVIDLTDAYTWTGAHEFDSTTRFDDDLDINADVVMNGKFTLNGTGTGAVLAWEGGTHYLYANDGAGNVGLRFANNYNGANELITEDGHACHITFNQSGGYLDFEFSQDGVVDEVISWAYVFRMNGSNGVLTWGGDSIWHEGNLNSLTTALAGESAWLPTSLLTGTISSSQIASLDAAKLTGTVNADTLDDLAARDFFPLVSSSDFADGTLVTTDIDASGTNGDSFTVEIEGKSYGSGYGPFCVIIESYLYADDFLSTATRGTSVGGYFPDVVLLEDGSGKLAIWWPRISYWNAFAVRVYRTNSSESKPRNRVVSIGNSTEPASSKKRTVSPKRAIYDNDAGIVSTTMIAAGAVSAEKIDLDNLTTALAGESAWLPTALLTGTISAGQIAANAVGTPEIATGAVTNAQLAAEAVTWPKLDPDMKPVWTGLHTHSDSIVSNVGNGEWAYRLVHNGHNSGLYRANDSAYLYLRDASGGYSFNLNGHTGDLDLVGSISMQSGETVDGRDLSADGASLDLIEATNIGLAGGAALETIASTAAWSKPLGYMSFVHGTSTDRPSGSAHGYFHLFGRRDVGGGWGGIYAEYTASGRLWLGRAESSATSPTWNRIYHSGNLADLTTALAGESAWLPTALLTGTISSGQIASLDAAKLTGTLGDGLVPESAVTQHEAALDINMRQLEAWTLTKPTGFPNTPEILPVQLPNGRYTGSVSAKSLRPTISGTTYYVDIALGNDSNAGTEAAPYKSVWKALVQTDVGLVKVAPGIYPWDHSWKAASIGIGTDAAYGVERWSCRPGEVILTAAWDEPTWTADGTYSHVYNSTGSFPGSVTDLGVQLHHGAYYDYVEVASLAACSAVRGSFYISGSTISVNPLRKGEPDDRVLVHRANHVIVENSRRDAWLSDFTVIGGATGVLRSNTSGTDGGRLIARRIRAYNSAGPGIQIKGVERVVLEDCEAYACAQDGITHSPQATTNRPRIVEVRCRSAYHGDGSATDTVNGFTSHDDVEVLRIECVGGASRGPGFADVNGDNYTWLVGCRTLASASEDEDTQETGFLFTGGAEAWLHDCEGTVDRQDLLVDVSSTAHLSRCTFASTVENGTVDTYAQA